MSALVPAGGADAALREDEYLITRTDIEGRMVYVNAAFAERSGYESGELLGQPASMMYAPDTPPELSADLWRTVKAHGAWTGVMRHRCKDGSCFWAQATITRTMQDGRHVGHTTVRTRAGEQEVARMRRFNAARQRGAVALHTLREGRLALRGIGGLLRLVAAPTLASRLALAQAANAVVVCLAAAQWLGARDAVPPAAIAICVVSLALGAALEMARRRIRRPVGRLLAHARGIGAGDLTWPAAPDTGADDEVARLGASMDVMQKSLASLVRDLREGVRTVDGAASEISDANMDLAARTEQTASAIEQAVGRMHDLSDAVHRNATHADRTHRLAASSRDAAEQGRELVRQVIDGMGDIARSTAGISDISSMIEGIAFQTNILALNAAVEAARAGTHGRGFAVVAAEVRSLAQRSSEAVRQISQLLDVSRGHVASGERLAQTAGGSIDEIVRLASQVLATVGEMSQASQSQHEEITRINGVIGRIDDAVRQNSAMVEQAAAAAASLADQSRRLDHSVSLFRTGAAH
ncbi:methyl-accepting chemotaxis protein [Paracidovorax citrulli]